MRLALSRAALVSFLVGVLSTSAFAVSYILPIDHTQGGTFTSVSGGYNGDAAMSHAGSAGDGSRVFWRVPASADPTPQLYKIEWWGAPGADHNDYQPFESQFNGDAGETYPIDPGIPWAGQFGTNHQWIANNAGANSVGAWNSTGPGPQVPASTDFNAGGNGTTMWLKAGSEIYAKWDFPWYNNTTNVLSDLRITPIPEPATAGLVLLGAAGMLLRRRRMA